MTDATIERSASSAAPLDVRRLLLIGAVLPAAIAGVNYALLYDRHPDTPLLVARLAWYVVQVGIVGFAVGRGIEHGLRWVVFGWLMVLINLLTWIEGAELSRWQHTGQLPVAALFGGEIGLCVVWAFLGDTRWQLRWPAMVLLVGGIFYVWRLANWNGPSLWSELMVLQVVTLAVLCGLLRWRRYVLRPADAEEVMAGNPSKRRPLQFGIKHVLIWTTALAVLLAMARGLDLLSWQAAQQLAATGLVWKLTVATASAMVTIVALWAALGRGHWLLRYLAVVLLALAVGLGLGQWGQASAVAMQKKANVATFFWSGNGAVFRGRGIIDWELMQWYEVGWWWLGWLFLSGGLLAATLIILRTIGYRLVRLAPARSNPVQ